MLQIHNIFKENDNPPCICMYVYVLGHIPALKLAILPLLFCPVH